MKSYFRKLMFIGTLLALTGCSSIMNHTGGGEQRFYPGTRSNYDMLTSDGPSVGMKSLVALDMPFSAVMDTLLLPWDAFRDDKSAKSRVEEIERKNAVVDDAIPPAT